MIEKPSSIVWLPDRTEDIYSVISESRHRIVFPWLAKAILARTPASVLDYGAGDGQFLISLLEAFRGMLLYYDPSINCQQKVRANAALRNVQVCPSPQSIRPSSIDVVVSIAVWMTLSSHDECIQYLRGMQRILRAGGTAFIAVTHPCFREEKYSTFWTEFDNTNYLNGGVPFKVTLSDDLNKLTILDYHWNLSMMTKQAVEAGFRILAIAELKDVDNGNSRGSPWLCFEFGKE